MRSANKVILNTGILYGRMLITMGLSLYTTRLVLNALGVLDFGIFNLIAGVIAMLSFLNAAMGVSTQRYFSFHQGKKDIVMQKKVFLNSLILHVIIGVVIIAGLEIAGLYIFDGFLKIPESRISSAITIYHFMSATVFFTVIAVPFTAVLNAHEDMLWISIVGIIETVLRMGIAFLLLIISSDKLIVYGVLTALISVIVFVLYGIYCLKYEEWTMNYYRFYDIGLIKEMSSFAGWNLFGALAGMGRAQGIAIILNLYFGATVNAAYGIANQVSGQLNFFSATMLRALNPQIMKSEGANDRSRMLRLSMVASKFGFFLLAFIAIPCIFEMHAILLFWLKNVPDNAVTFCSLILIASLMNQLTIGLQSAVQATGKVKVYQAVVGFVLLLNLPIAFFLLKFKLPAYSVLLSFIVIQFIASIMRIFFLKVLVGLSVRDYVRKVFVSELFPVISSVLVCFLITNYVHMDYRFLFTLTVSIVVFTISIYFSGLSKEEKDMIHGLFFKLKVNFKKYAF